MDIQVLGSRRTVLPPGWGEETNLCVVSSARIDATAAPGEDAKLTIITFLSSATVFVPVGARIQLSGGDIFGSHSVDVEPSPDGPSIMIQAHPILGSVKIRS